MTPTNSANFAAYGANIVGSAVGESVQRSGTGDASANEPSSGNDGINSEFLARHNTDRSLVDSLPSFPVNDASNSHTACAINPVLSIPTGADIATTSLQWRYASEPSADESLCCTSPVATPEVVASPCQSSDKPLFDDAALFEAVAATEAEETNIVRDRAELFRSSRDARLGELVSRFRECFCAVEAELLERLEEEKQWVAPLTAARSDLGIRVSRLDSATVTIAGLRRSYQEVNEQVQDSCALIEQLLKERTKGSEPSAAEDTVKPLCEHHLRRCFVKFSCCRVYYPCHRCHNDAGECGNTEVEALHATHLKCAKCHVEQEINEDSHHCSSCHIKLSEYFCGKCKHFTSKRERPYHCDKCGICRIHKEGYFHCDVCNFCMDIRLQGAHTCRPDSAHELCGICQEDCFSGSLILGCSHKVHQECGIEMVEKGGRACPTCRSPIDSRSKVNTSREWCFLS